MVIFSVSTAAPAGTQNSEQTPVEPLVGQGALSAQTDDIPGNLRLFEKVLGRDKRENVTAKVRIILSEKNLVRFKSG